MTRDVLSELRRRLDEHGVRGRAAERFLAEAGEHLREAELVEGEAEALHRFGDLDLVAREVAAETATTRVRTATFASFAVLAAVGLAYTAILALVPLAGGWPDLFGGKVASLGPITGLAAALLPQIAFVSGCLALLAGLRLRGVEAAPRAELRLVRRRNAVALVAGAGTLLALGVSAVNTAGLLAGWWVGLTVTLALMLSVSVAVAGLALLRSAAPDAAPGGRADDIFDELAPVFGWAPVRRLELPEHPWRFASLCAAAVFVAGAVGGWYAEGDPASGLVRGAFETVALVACFAVLGRPLGVRRAA